MNRRKFLQTMASASAALSVTSCSKLFSTEATKPSSKVRLSQVGFLPDASKKATVVGSGKFLVRRADANKPLLNGALDSARDDAASGETVRIVDLTSIREPGSYVLELEDGSSEPFTVAADAYDHALWLTMRSYYGQRCGCVVDLGDGYSHPACHTRGKYNASSGKSGDAPSHFGWHDAGDYGRYIVNAAVATSTLLWAWELYGDGLRKLSLKIPESGGKVPDFLAEVRWNLEWMLSLQDEDGGVWHKQTSTRFCDFIMPEKDDLPSEIIGTGSAPFKSTCATADLAATCAIAARCYGPFDDAFAKRCLTAATRAYAWARQHPSVVFRNPSGVSTGEYGDADCTDELFWAAAELWRTTSDKQYLDTVAAMPKPSKLPDLSWGGVSPLGWWTLALADRAASHDLGEVGKELSQSRAEELLQRSSRSGYGCTLDVSDYVWGSNGVVGNQAMQLLVAHQMHSNPAMRAAALDDIGYLLGRNCFGVSWVTQLGTRPFQHPHHRPSGADGINAPWPGLLSGGPNSTPGDLVARRLPKAAPMRMWVDDQGAYSMNEIAINWNAPLVFALAGAARRS